MKNHQGIFGSRYAECFVLLDFFSKVSGVHIPGYPPHEAVKRSSFFKIVSRFYNLIDNIALQALRLHVISEPGKSVAEYRLHIRRNILLKLCFVQLRFLRFRFRYLHIYSCRNDNTVKSFYHYYIIKFETADRSVMVFRGSAISRVIEGFPASSREEGSAYEKKNGVINRYFFCLPGETVISEKSLRRAPGGDFT